MVPTKAVPADAMVRVDKAGTPAIAIPVITSLAHSIATCLSIAGQDGPDRQDRRDGGKQSESAHIIPPQSECSGATIIPQVPLVILALDQLDPAAPSVKRRSSLRTNVVQRRSARGDVRCGMAKPVKRQTLVRHELRYVPYGSPKASIRNVTLSGGDVIRARSFGDIADTSFESGSKWTGLDRDRSPCWYGVSSAAV